MQDSGSHPDLTGFAKAGRPALSNTDPDERPTEWTRLYKSFIFRDPAKRLGAPFVMFYNAHSQGDSERIFAAVSSDMRPWKRHLRTRPRQRAPAPTQDRHLPRSANCAHQRLWVMFYFGAFWKPGAFDTFAVSRDLVNWTKWDGPDLISSSEPWDNQYAHKPWILKHDGVVYHFYCAVDKSGKREIALATSVDLRKK